MRLLHFVYTRLGIFVLPIVVKGSWMLGDIFHSPITHLNTRQSSGTGGAAQFLRRAFHACKKTWRVLHTGNLAANRM